MEKADQFFESKKEGLEQVLGPMHAVVGHSLIPYQAGGSIDMGYFCRMLPGTVITTMELIGLDGGGPQPNRFGTFELVACTRHPYQVEPGAAADPSLISATAGSSACWLATARTSCWKWGTFARSQMREAK